MEHDEETPRKAENLAHKIISVAAGEAHTLALTGDGKVYSWGRGFFGRLGTGSEEDQILPCRVKFQGSDVEQEDEINIVGIAAGAYHSLALADNGSVWGWGYNSYGQIGDNGERSLVPHMVEGFPELGSSESSLDDHGIKSRKPLKMSSIKSGGMMSAAIDSQGALWMWGNCPQNPQGNLPETEFSLVSSSSPIPVWDFHGRTVVNVACGNEHVVALVSAGETYKGGDLICYSWGGNTHGQLGLGDKESRLHPEVIETFNLESSWEVYEIACGASHTVLLTHKKRPTDTLESVCWTFGLGENGQLGHGTTKSFTSPEPVRQLPQSIFLVSVDCGLFHTSVVSSNGDVWSWGMERGLGLCPDASFTGNDSGDAISPLQIPCNEMYGSKFPEPLQVACGAAHTVLLGEAGYKLWSWGRGRNGVLGNGKTVDCYVPTKVLWPPLANDFTDETSGNSEVNKTGERNQNESLETDKRLSMAMDEMKLLQSKLSLMETYASILHGSVFGKPLQMNDIPTSIQSSTTFDIAREWENMLESLDNGKLLRLEKFYQDMLAGVKDKLMKRRIQEIVKEYLESPATRAMR